MDHESYYSGQQQYLTSNDLLAIGTLEEDAYYQPISAYGLTESTGYSS
jgi:hypothetical protein